MPQSSPPDSPPRPPNSLPPSLLERYFAQHEFSTPLLACCSDVEPLTVRELLEVSGGNVTPEEESFGGLSLGYLDPRGGERLRAAVAREHGGGGGQENAVTADDVLVAAPQELAYLLQRAVLQEGDTVVAQWPGYPGLTAVAEAVGATVVPWLPRWEEEEEDEMEEEEESSRSHPPPPRRKTLRPRFDVEEDLRAALEKAAALVRDNCGGQQRSRRPSALRLAVLNFPHNPTGCTFPSGSAGLERAISLCLDAPGGGARHVLSDEMYRGIHLKTLKTTAAESALPTAAALAASSPALAGRRERVASLGGLSKCGTPGLRVGWLVTRDRELLERMSALRDHTTICNSAPSEALALAALEGGGGESGGGAAALRARARAIVEGNLAAARAFFATYADLFEFYAPDASTTCLPRLRTEALGEGISADEFARRAREDAGVLLLPASAFGETGGEEAPAPWMEGRFRLGLGRRNLPAALEALAKLAEEMRGEKTGAGLL